MATAPIVQNPDQPTPNVAYVLPEVASKVAQWQVIRDCIAGQDAIKAATTAHLLETCLHECTHGLRHAQAMTETEPDDVWAFNYDHCAKHLGGAVEHVGKLAGHFQDNYPDVSRWLAGLGDITSGQGEDGGGKQHARYSKGTMTAQMANPLPVSGQALALPASRSVFDLAVDRDGPGTCDRGADRARPAGRS